MPSMVPSASRMSLTAEIQAFASSAVSSKRPLPAGMVRNIRHLFQRGEVTEQELRTLHGMVTELAHGRHQRRPTGEK